MNSRDLQGRLGSVTETLARAVVLRQPEPSPEWSDTDWRLARAMAVVHGIAPLLARWHDFGPPSWQAFVADQYAQVGGRHRRIEALLAAIAASAASAGVAFVPLKGAALHALGLYAPGERPMADLDLLVRDDELQALAALFLPHGYHVVATSTDGQVLLPREPASRPRFAEHASSGITIELHTRMCQPLPVREVDLTSTLWPSVPRAGSNDYASPAALLVHLVMHAAVNMQSRMLRFVQLYDLALLAPRLRPEDWTSMLALAAATGRPAWVYPPLRLLTHYCPGSVPPDVLAAASAACPPLLRRIAGRLRVADVSVSHLRRSPLYGITWSRSWSEAGACIQRRFRRGARSLRGDDERPARAQRTPWESTARRRRVLDVLLGRPRPETLYMVDAALRGEY